MSQEPALETSADVEEAETQNVAPQKSAVNEIENSASNPLDVDKPTEGIETAQLSIEDPIPERDSDGPITRSNDSIDENESATNSDDANSGPQDIAPEETADLIRKAKSTTVADMNACGDAGKLIRKLTQAVKRTKEDLAPLKTRLSSAKKEFQEAESIRLKPLVEAEKLLKSSIEIFLTKESARRRHQRELQELARQESIAEREKRIETLEEEGKIEEARTLANEYPPELPPVPAIPVPKMISAKATRRSEVNDLHALIRFIAEHPEHSDLLRPSTAKLNAMARKTPGESPLPGVEFLTEQKVTSK